MDYKEMAKRSADAMDRLNKKWCQEELERIKSGSISDTNFDYSNCQLADCDLNDGKLAIDSVRQLLAEAYRQGYKDANALVCHNGECNQRIPPIPHGCMTEETAKELEDILAKTREESVKCAAIQKDLQEIIRQVNEQHLPKDLPNLVSKEEFRNRLNHKE